MTARTQTPDEERIRRMLFVLVVSYIVSSWMVDFEYRPTFFMFTAAIAAFHRHLLGLIAEREESAEDQPLAPFVPVWHPSPLLPRAGARHGARRLALRATTPFARIGSRQGFSFPFRSVGDGRHRRPLEPLPLIDGIIILILTYVVIRFWAYIMMRM